MELGKAGRWRYRSNNVEVACVSIQEILHNIATSDALVIGTAISAVIAATLAAISVIQNSKRTMEQREFSTSLEILEQTTGMFSSSLGMMLKVPSELTKNQFELKRAETINLWRRLPEQYPQLNSNRYKKVRSAYKDLGHEINNFTTGGSPSAALDAAIRNFRDARLNAFR